MSETVATYDAGPAPKQIKMRPCFFCGQHMYGTSYREVTNERTGRTYVKLGFVCPHCDYWQYSRIPAKLTEQIPPQDQFHLPERVPDTEEDVIPPMTNVLDYEAQLPLRNFVEIRFKCILCQNPMPSIHRGEETNERTGHVYLKTRYFCRHCDTWETIKVPRKLAETVTREQP